MATYRIDDVIVETGKALARRATTSQSWQEGTRWDGRNHVSLATGSQWDHQTLYRSRRGRYYVVHTSQWQGSRAYGEFVSSHQAAVWLLANEHQLPAELMQEGEAVQE